MVCRSSAFSPNTCQSKCFPLRSSSRPIHSGGNERRSLEFINDSRIRLLSSFHSINTIITIRVTGVTTMTHGPRRADRERSLPIITGRSICQFTTSLLPVVWIIVLSRYYEKKRISRNEFIFLSWKPTLMFNNLRKRWFIRKKEKKKEKKRH